MNLAPNWRDFETMEEAASRLLRVLDERVKNRKTLAGGDVGPAQIADQSDRSLVSAEKAAEPAWNANKRCPALDRLAPPVAAAGRCGSSGLEDRRDLDRVLRRAGNALAIPQATPDIGEREAPKDRANAPDVFK